MPLPALVGLAGRAGISAARLGGDSALGLQVSPGRWGIELEGVDELQRFMKKAGPKMTAKHMRRATSQGAAMVRKATIAAAPRATGRLAKNIKNKGRRAKRSYVKASVYVRTAPRTQQHDITSGKFLKGSTGRNDPQDAYYWKFLERGTRYMPAQPFIRPTAERMFKPVVRHVITEANRGIREDLRATR